MVSVYKEVEVDFDLEDVATADLIDELEERGIPVMDKDSPVFLKIQDIYQAYTLNQPIQVDDLLRELFYNTIGRIV